MLYQEIFSPLEGSKRLIFPGFLNENHFSSSNQDYLAREFLERLPKFSVKGLYDREREGLVDEEFTSEPLP